MRVEMSRIAASESMDRQINIARSNKQAYGKYTQMVSENNNKNEDKNHDARVDK